MNSIVFIFFFVVASFAHGAPRQPIVLWKFSTTSLVINGPAASNDSVFYGTAHSLNKIHEMTGAPEWTVPVNDTVGGIFHSPVVTDNGDTIFVVENPNALAATLSIDGKRKWYLTFPDASIAARPTVSYGHLLVTLTSGRIVCLNHTLGNTQWSVNLNETGTDASVPITSLNGVYVATSSSVFAISPWNGMILWQYTFNPSTIVLTPTFHNGLLFVLLSNSTLVAVDTMWGSPKWFVAIPTLSPNARVSAHDSIVAVVDGNKVIGVHPLQGNIRWTETVDSSLSGVFVRSDVVLAFGTDGVIYGLDVSLGSVLWKVVISTSQSLHADVASFDDKIIGATDSMVFAIQM
eukprot:PhF_6_TR1417/c1_g1_i1/m.2479/K17713/bamB; outer membrane protein assembly factor BamB